VVKPWETLPGAIREPDLDAPIGEYLGHSHSLLSGLRASGTVERRVTNFRQGIDFQDHFTHAHGCLRLLGRVVSRPLRWCQLREDRTGITVVDPGGFERSLVLVQQNSTRRCAAGEWFTLLFDR